MPYLVFIIIGLLLPLAFNTSPAGLSALNTALCSIPLLALRRTRWLACFLLAFAWSLWAIEQALESRILKPANPSAWVGEIVGLPIERNRLVEFRFRPQHANGTWLVRWYEPGIAIKAGEVWRLPLKLRPPRGRLNFGGPDRERWYFAEGISALGTVSAGEPVRLEAAPVTSVNSLRLRVREELMQILGAHQGAALMLALSIADRSRMTSTLREALQETGTGHLIAISGLHVGLVAGLFYWLGRLLSLAAFGYWRGSCTMQWGWCFSVLGAFGYALLAGLETSVLRAWIMLLVLAAYRLLRLQPPPLRAWCIALVMVLTLQPLSPLGAGFWLSFAAVLALMWVFQPRQPVVGSLRALVYAQGGIFLCMTGLGLYWFQQISYFGLLVNLLAIPWVSLITLPLTMFALILLPFGGPASEIVTYMAADSAWLLVERVLLWPTTIGSGVIRSGVISPGGLLVMTSGAVVLLLPSGLKWRVLGLVALLPIVLSQPRKPLTGDFSIELLDVGQGLAALIRTNSHQLLYDTGPGMPGEWDFYNDSIRPALAGQQPDRVIVSHGDLDHAGAINTLQQLLPPEKIVFNRPGEGVQYGCYRGLGWAWDDIDFEVYHPGFYLPYRGNNSSCVLSVRSANYSLLLPGDIEKGIESALVLRGLEPHTTLIAPHHGSKTSSTLQFLQAVQPKLVLYSTAFNNRFGHPHDAVLQRVGLFTDQAWSTADCGALKIHFNNNTGLTVASARKTRPAIWRFAPAANCP